MEIFTYSTPSILFLLFMLYLFYDFLVISDLDSQSVHDLAVILNWKCLGLLPTIIISSPNIYQVQDHLKSGSKG